MNIQELEKLPGLLLQLVKKVPQEIEAGVKSGISTVEGRVSALEAKVLAGTEANLDAKVKSALESLIPSFSFDDFETAIGNFGSGTSDAKTTKQDSPNATTSNATTTDSKKADLSSLVSNTGLGFSDFSHAVDAMPPAAVGSADTSNTTIGLQPTEIPQKVDPATAGKQAADAAIAAGADPVPAAAKAAHAAAAELGTDALKAATDAAAAAGAGLVEAARAADNAAAAVAQGQSPATT